MNPLSIISDIVRTTAPNKITLVLAGMHIHGIWDANGHHLLLKSSAEEKVFHFNGAIMDRKGNILSMPARRLIKDVPDIDTKQYYVYPAVNGTVVNIYRSGNTLCMSTSRGHDVTELCLFGETTFGSILDELMSMHDMGQDSFAPGYSYTLVLTHPRYHHLNIKCLTFISAYNLVKKRYEIPDIWAPLSHNERGPWSVAHLKKEAGYAHHLFLHGFDHDQLATESPPFFGFVLRARDQSKGPDYYIESDLMRALRVHVYSSYTAAYKGVVRENRILLHLYLNNVNDELVELILGETASQKFEKLDQLLEKVNEYLLKRRVGLGVEGGELWAKAAEKISSHTGVLRDRRNLDALLVLL